MPARPPAAGRLGLAATLALVGALAACSSDDDGGSAEPIPDDPDATIVAEDMAFDPDDVRLAAGEPATIVIDNRDGGVQHNVHVEGAPEPNSTPLEAGESRQALTVELDAGTYTFVCDIHPNMEGVIVAE
jgi:plastocyanin